MAAEDKKQFIIPQAVARAIDEHAENLGGKGHLRRIGTAGLLMYLHASEQDRAGYILWGDAILLGAASLDDPPIVARVTSLGFRKDANLRVWQARLPLEPWRGSVETEAEPSTILTDDELEGIPLGHRIPVLDPEAGDEPAAPRDGNWKPSVSGWFLVFDAGDPLACAIEVEGRAMECDGYFKHGDYVVVSPGRAAEWRPGMLGVVVFEGKRRYDFRLIRKAGPRSYRLSYINDDFGEETVMAKEIRAIYPVILAVRR